MKYKIVIAILLLVVAGFSLWETFNSRSKTQKNALDSSHWAFSVPKAGAIPRVRGTEWPKNPIDAFVLARLETEGVQPAAQAEPPTLIRRLRLDLTGLAPTPEEVSAFCADAQPEAYERLVDRLLDLPEFGEHWARHWLD